MLRFCLFIAFSIVLVATESNDTSIDTITESEGDYRDTVIFLRVTTNWGQRVFIRGGVGNRTDCRPEGPPETDPCAIPINHLDLKMTSDTPERDTWAKDDLYLTWGRTHIGDNLTLDGTPAQWTTSDQSQDYFHVLNKYGPHYWMVAFEMDCSQLDNGFFDVKGILDGNWENDIHQGPCEGDGAATPGYSSINHIARCGYINVFEWSRPGCIVESIY